MTTRKGDLLALIAGVMLPLAFSPLEFYPLAVLSLALLFYCWTNVSPGLAARRGGLFGLGMFGVGVSWVFVAIYVFGGSGLIVSTLLTVLFVVFLASYLALLGWLVRKFVIQDCKASLLCIFPLGWLIFEAFKAWFLSGFPWLELGVSQIDGPLAGYVPLLGVLGVSMLVAVSASLLLCSLQYKSWPAAAALCLLWLSGEGLRQLEWTQPVDKPIKVTLIQGNVSQAIKWQAEHLLNTLDLYKKLTQLHWDSDLIVWPESALPAFYHQVKDFYLQPLHEQALATGSDILLGVPFYHQADNIYYNSLLLLGRQSGFYHKRHLVPFGDYVPFEWLRGLLAFFSLPMSSFSPGPSDQALLTAVNQPIASSVCYEDAFSLEVLESLPEATLLINATNNAWYGDSFAPHQHLQISRSRALETGRPLIRVTTNGISAFVDAKGHIQQQTPQFEQAILTAQVQPMTGSTPYVRWQYWPLLVFSVFMLLVWGYYRQRILK